MGYLIAAYTVGALGVFGYALRLSLRSRRLSERLAELEARAAAGDGQRARANRV